MIKFVKALPLLICLQVIPAEEALYNCDESSVDQTLLSQYNSQCSGSNQQSEQCAGLISQISSSCGSAGATVNHDATTVTTGNSGTTVTNGDTTVTTNNGSTTVNTSGDTSTSANSTGSTQSQETSNTGTTQTSGTDTITVRNLFSGIDGLYALSVEAPNNPALQNLMDSKWNNAVQFYLAHRVYRMPTELVGDLAAIGIRITFAETERQLSTRNDLWGTVNATQPTGNNSSGTTDNGQSSGTDSNSGTSASDLNDQCGEFFYRQNHPDECANYDATNNGSSGNSTGGTDTTSSTGNSGNDSSSGTGDNSSSSGNTSGGNDNTSTNTGNSSTGATASTTPQYQFKYGYSKWGDASAIGALYSSTTPPNPEDPQYKFGKSPTGWDNLTVLGAYNSDAEGDLKPASTTANRASAPVQVSAPMASMSMLSAPVYTPEGISAFAARTYGSTNEDVMGEDLDISSASSGESKLGAPLRDTPLGPVYEGLMADHKEFAKIASYIKNLNISLPDMKLIFADDTTLSGIKPIYNYLSNELILGLNGFPYTGEDNKTAALSHVLHELTYSRFSPELLEFREIYLGSDQTAYYNEYLASDTGAFMEGIASYMQGLYFSSGWNQAQAQLAEQGFVSESNGNKISFNNLNTYQDYFKVPATLANILLEFVHRAPAEAHADMIVQEAIQIQLMKPDESDPESLLRTLAEQITQSQKPDYETLEQGLELRSSMRQLLLEITDSMTAYKAEPENLKELTKVNDAQLNEYTEARNIQTIREALESSITPELAPALDATLSQADETGLSMRATYRSLATFTGTDRYDGFAVLDSTHPRREDSRPSEDGYTEAAQSLPTQLISSSPEEDTTEDNEDGGMIQRAY